MIQIYFKVNVTFKFKKHMRFTLKIKHILLTQINFIAIYCNKNFDFIREHIKETVYVVQTFFKNTDFLSFLKIEACYEI